MQQQQANKSSAIKPVITNLSLGIIIIAIAIGIGVLGISFGQLSAQILLAPISLLLAFPSNAIALIVIAVAAVMVWSARKNPKLWFLPPIAATLVSIVWVVACMVIVQLVQRR